MIKNSNIFLIILLGISIPVLSHSWKLNLRQIKLNPLLASQETEIGKSYAQKFARGNRIRGDAILDTKTLEKTMTLRQPVIKSNFVFPSPPYPSYNRKFITFVEILVTSDSKDVDVDVYSGGIGKSNMILIVTGYNAQVLNAKVTVFGI